MSRVITLNSYSLGSARLQSRSEAKGQANRSKILSMGNKKIPKIENSAKGNSKITFMALMAVLIASILISGAFYLYQVNDLATKGYEIRDIENRIQNLDKENKKMQIKEVELRSMYNIEKSSQELNLVNPANITYLEMESSVAMK